MPRSPPPPAVHADSGGGCHGGGAKGRAVSNQAQVASTTGLGQPASRGARRELPSRVAQRPADLSLAPLNTCVMLSIQRAVALAAVAAVALAAFAPLPAAAAVPDPLRLRPPGCNPANCSSCLEYSLHVSSWLCCCEAGIPARVCMGSCACGAACKGGCLASGLVLFAVCHPCMDRLRPQCTGRQHHRHRNQRNCG